MAVFRCMNCSLMHTPIHILDMTPRVVHCIKVENQTILGCISTATHLISECV